MFSVTHIECIRKHFHRFRGYSHSGKNLAGCLNSYNRKILLYSVQKLLMTLWGTFCYVWACCVHLTVFKLSGMRWPRQVGWEIQQTIPLYLMSTHSMGWLHNYDVYQCNQILNRNRQLDKEVEMIKAEMEGFKEAAKYAYNNYNSVFNIMYFIV